MKKHEIWPVISNITEDIDVTWNDVASLVSEYGVPLFFNFQVLPNYFNATDNFIYVSYRERYKKIITRIKFVFFFSYTEIPYQIQLLLMEN